MRRPIDMQTKVKTETFKNALEARKERVEDALPAIMKAYEDAVLEWKLALAQWIKANGGQRVAVLVPWSDLYNARERGFDAVAFFDGAPVPPKRPNDYGIDEIRALIQQLALTDQASVTVDTEMIKRLRLLSDEL
jgi:hypothetical protein